MRRPIASLQLEELMAKRTFDSAGFFAAIDAQRQAKGKTWKQVAADAGISASTLTRMSQGRRPDVDGLASLLSWSGLDADDFIRDETEEHEEPETLARISTYLRADPRLSNESAHAIEQIISVAYDQMARGTDDGTATRVQNRGERPRA
jgi:transcriptional regulator with XRE-family HTH domain